MTLETERLVLRRWRASDREPFRAMNADSRVMEFFPSTLSASESDALVERIERNFDVHGFGLWAAEVRATPSFIGYVGLAVPAFEAAFTPCVEIGWRLSVDYWGQGFATEAAREVLRYGFEGVNLTEILSWTAVANMRSRRVMEKLGMTHDPADDFDHPRLPHGHPLRRHVLYRLQRTAAPDSSG